MNNDDFLELIQSISSNPSVLFLGQNYLTYGSEHYFDDLAKQLDLPDNVRSFAEIWTCCNDKKRLTDLRTAMDNVSDHYGTRSWFRSVMCMRWNIVYTSSPDIRSMRRDLGSNFSAEFINKTNDKFTREYTSKNTVHLLPLFLDENDEMPNSVIELAKTRNNSSSQIHWIYDDIISKYGFLVVDGLADDDWVNALDLIKNIDSVSPGCVYFFGMTPDRLTKLCSKTDSNQAVLIREYINQGYIITVEKSLPDMLEESGWFDNDDDDVDIVTDRRSVAVTFPQKRNDRFLIPIKKIRELSMMGITVLYDDLVQTRMFSELPLKEQFLKFLTNEKTDWNRYSTTVSAGKKEISFYVPRQFDDKLMELVNRQLKRAVYKRNVVFVKGISNSGKTAALINLAKRICNGEICDKPVLVIYIHGNPDIKDRKGNWKTALSDFIKKTVNPSKTKNGDRIKETIIIWDNNSAGDTKRDYYDLKNSLNDVNVLIVGSLYTLYSDDSDTKSTITISAELNSQESKSLNRLLNMIDPVWGKSFSAHSSKVNTSGMQYLFDLLNRFAVAQQSSDWLDVSSSLRFRLQGETNQTEQTSGSALANTDDDFSLYLKSIDDIQRLGIAPAFQLDVEKNAESSEIMQNALNDIKKINLILATAGEFNCNLPLTLLLKIIRKDKTYKNQFRFITNVLKNDTLISYEDDTEYGDVVVSFRHTSEADAYLRNNFANEKERIVEEVNALISVINACDWSENSDESKSVVRMVRSFGPNSYGKYGEKPSRGNYYRYADFWNVIIDTISGIGETSRNSEAVLIVSHFTREIIKKAATDNKLEDANQAISQLECAEDSLHYAIDRLKDYAGNERKLIRLYGEICSNLTARMKLKPELSDELFRDVRLCFPKALKQLKSIISRNQNCAAQAISLLDIWLNAYQNQDAKLKEEYLDLTLEYIDMLLSKYDNKESLPNSYSGHNDMTSLVKKIEDVYQEARKTDFSRIAGMDNDCYIFIQCRKFALDAMERYREKLETYQIASTRVFYFYEKSDMDFPDNDNNQLYSEIKDELKHTADKIITLLEKEQAKIEKTKSYRCEYLLLKAKWLSYNGSMLLEEKQCPKMTKEQWKEIFGICERCRQYSIAREEESDIAVNFLMAVYQWCFMEKSDYHFSGVKYYNMNVELIGLCDKYGVPIPIIVETKKFDSDKLRAIITSVDSEQYKAIKNRNRLNGIYISKYTDIEQSPKTNIKDMMLWFNLGGPIVDINYFPNKGGNKDE